MVKELLGDWAWHPMNRKHQRDLADAREPTEQHSDLLCKTPAPLAASSNDMAARLRALAPKPATQKQSQEALCRLLHRIAQDPAVQAIVEQIAKGHTPAREYALSDTILLTKEGALLVHGTQRLAPEMLSILIRSGRFTTDLDCRPEALACLEATVTQRVADIGANLIEHFSQVSGTW